MHDKLKINIISTANISHIYAQTNCVKSREVKQMQTIDKSSQQKNKTEKPTPRNNPQPYKNPQKNTQQPMQF